MAFSMMGSTGQVRHRIHPKAERGPSGYKGPAKSALSFDVKRTHTVRPAAQRKEKSVVSKAFGKVKAFFARGNR